MAIILWCSDFLQDVYEEGHLQVACAELVSPEGLVLLGFAAGAEGQVCEVLRRQLREAV